MRQVKTSRLLAIAVVACAPLLMAASCQTLPSPEDHPCGVITDSLRDVHGKTAADEQRIDSHFERGVAAKCWKRAAS